MTTYKRLDQVLYHFSTETKDYVEYDRESETFNEDNSILIFRIDDDWFVRHYISCEEILQKRFASLDDATNFVKSKLEIELLD